MTLENKNGYPCQPYDIDIERMSKKLEYYYEKTDTLSALVAASKKRIAALEKENAKLRASGIEVMRRYEED